MLLGLAATSLPAQQTPADRVIQSLQLHAKMYPQDPAGYDRLGAAYLQKGRETGDASYYELAKKALDKSLELESDGPDAASATAHMAIVYMAQHRFDQALTWAENALALGSGDLSPWAIVVDALTDMGEYGKALEYCSRLETPAGSAAGRDWSYERNSRLSYLKFISGDTRSATELMRSAIRAATANQMPRENIAWSQYQLGDECYRTGDLAGAESAFQDSLATYPGYYRALAGLAAVRAAQKRYPESIELYQRAVAVIPDPIFVAALGDAYAKVGRPAEAQTEYDLVEFIGRLSEINKVLYNRDLAIFYADHDRKLQEAVDLARKELEVRRDVYTWDALAWALYKSGRASEAREPMEKALRPGLKTSPENRPESSSTTGLAGPTGLTGVTAGRAAGATTGPETGPQDVMLFFHAGMIYDRLGETAKARDYLDRALSADPNFHPFYAEVAGRTLSRLGKM